MVQLLNDIWSTGCTPTEWKMAEIINIHKKGDKHKCCNYRGISLLNSGYKIYANIIKTKLQPIVENILQEEQCGFRKGRSCIDAIFTIKQIMEKRLEYNLPLYLLFLDYVKAYDRVNKSKLWKILGEYKIPSNLINAIKSLYDQTEIKIRVQNKYKSNLSTNVNTGLRQGCGLSSLLFDNYINAILEE